jgi:hypothetical protein
MCASVFALLTVPLFAYNRLVSASRPSCPFTHLQIGWPGSLTTVFKFASFTTVNVDSASPECSVKGLGYYQKWFFTQLLPLCFAALLVIVYVVKFTVAWVKWKLTPPLRRKPLKGKGYMTLVNLYLGALNLMYIFLIQKALEVHRVRPAR